MYRRNKLSEEDIMKLEKFKESFKSFCQKVGKRNFIIAGAVLLIAAAVIINAVLNAKDNAEETENTIEIIEGLEDRTETGAAVAYT